MSRKLLFNKNNANSYGYVRYAGAIISAKNTVKATMKNAILKGMSLQEGATAIDRNNQIGGHKA